VPERSCDELCPPIRHRVGISHRLGNKGELAGRVFTKFHLDIGIWDAIVPLTEIVSGRDWLDFAGIPLVPYSAISKEQQFAEKFHAYTCPRETSNARVKDLRASVNLACYPCW